MEEADNDAGKPISINQFSSVKGIPKTIFKHYVYSEKSKRHKVGTSVGKNPILHKHYSELLCQTAIRSNRANKGLKTAGFTSKIQLLNPGLSEDQANNHFHCNFKKKHKGRIKPKAVISQKTTSRRSQSTVSQQFMGRTNIDKAIAFLQEHNIGICRVTEKLFG